MEKKKSQIPRLTPGRKRIFFVMTISLPVIFFICLELILRWFNYGHNLSLFGRQEIRGQVYSVMNPDVKFRYFGTMQFTPATSLHYFKMPKPEGVYRIFCLGGLYNMRISLLFQRVFFYLPCPAVDSSLSTEKC